MSGILQKYTELVTIQDKNRIRAAQESTFKLDAAQLGAIAVENPGLGQILIVEVPGEPRAVLEVVINGAMKDSVSTLYVAHPLFNNRQAYMDARAELVTLINDFGDAGEAGVAINCPLRKRKAHMRDLGFAQLLDLVKFIVARASK
jgi:hypothetical protein